MGIFHSTGYILEIIDGNHQVQFDNKMIKITMNVGQQLKLVFTSLSRKKNAPTVYVCTVQSQPISFLPKNTQKIDVLQFETFSNDHKWIIKKVLRIRKYSIMIIDVQLECTT